MKLKIILICFLISLMLTSVSASLYSEKIKSFTNFGGKIVSTETLWSVVLEMDKEEDITIRWVRLTYEAEDKRYGTPIKVTGNEVLTYVKDKENEYTPDSGNTYLDETYTVYFWGCLKGASFTQKLGSIIKKISGKETTLIDITSGEKEILNKEAKEIIKTPGTGAFNARKCYESCFETYSYGKGDCSISPRCPLSPEDSKNLNKCSNDCVVKYNCGTIIERNSYAPDGYVGVKGEKIVVKDDKDVVKYTIVIKINPNTGNIISEGSSINGKAISKVISEEGNYYSYARAI